MPSSSCVVPVLLGFAILCAPSLQVRQTKAVPTSLHAAVERVASDPGEDPPLFVEKLDSTIKAASLPEIKSELPRLIELEDSADPRVRRGTVMLLFALWYRQVGKTGLMDSSVLEMLVPYIPHIAAHLKDSASFVRNMDLMLFVSFAVLRPVPPSLIPLSLDLLQQPDSTVRPVDPGRRPPFDKGSSLGPSLLSVLLAAGATLAPDPVTGIPEGRDIPEVQHAIIDFIQRPDQTSESRTETVRAIALAQAQNPDVNAALLPWLNNTDPHTVEAVLEHLQRLTLAPAVYAEARATVTTLSANPKASADLRAMASALLRCWTNNRHENGLCPTPPGMVESTP